MSAVNFWRRVQGCLHADERVFLALVAENTKHSPGTRGARMGVRADGTTFGTIGGGIMERRTIERAQEALARPDTAPAWERLFHRRKADGPTSGLICAGNQTNLYFVCDPQRDRATVDTIVERLDRDHSGLVVVTGEGLRLEEGELEVGRPAIRLLEGQQGAGEGGWRYEEQLLNPRRVAIIGSGHCGLALSRTMAGLGYAVTVFETRPDVHTLTANTHATHRHVVADYADAGALIGHEPWTCVVVMTSDYPSDVRGLLGVAERGFPYVGVMGAPAKLTRIFSDLRELGVSDAALERLVAPIGLPMASNTPEEIAISVAAQLLQLRSQGAVPG